MKTEHLVTPTAPTFLLGKRSEITKFTRGLAATAALAFSCFAAPTQASYVAYLYEDNGNVIADGSGSFDLYSVTEYLSGITYGFSGLNGGVRAITIGGIGSAIYNSDIEAYFVSSMSPPSPFGVFHTVYVATNYTDGDFSGVDSSSIYVPKDYISGAPLAGTNTWFDATLDSLGVTIGTYTWTWGSGEHADSYTLNIGMAPPTHDTPAATPEPATWTMLLAGLGLIGATLRRRGTDADRHA